MNLHVWKDVDYRGRLTRVDYTTKDVEGKPWYKYALVYLPYDYDDKKPYNILYLMHGGGGNPDAWTDCSQIKNALDRAFNEKLAEPFIVVFPTFYSLTPAQARIKREHAYIDAFPDDRFTGPVIIIFSLLDLPQRTLLAPVPKVQITRVENAHAIQIHIERHAEIS